MSGRCSRCGRPLPAGGSCYCDSPTIGLSASAPGESHGVADEVGPRANHGAPSVPGYRLLGLLGEGGMGSVHLAEDVALGRRVAIKLIRERLTGGSQGAERFLREARVLASVEHSGIVRLYAFGEADGRPYFVMELVEGETLAARLGRGVRLPLGETIAILLQVVDALEAAWEKGIVHRDVKPSNILLDRKGRVRVADFGLAKPVRGSGDGELSLTGDGLLIGTPAYLAPEQARGLKVDFRADVYSLGCVLYEMLTGRPPFQGPSVLAVVDQHLHADFPSLREERPDLPDSVNRLAERMTRREPAERPGSYAELRSKIAALAGEAGTAAATVISEERRPAAGPPSPALLPARGTLRPWRPFLHPIAADAVSVLLLGGLFVMIGAWGGSRDAAALVSTPVGFAVAVAPFHGPDEESTRDGRVMSALVEKELVQRLRDVRVLGLDEVRESPRSAEAARELGLRLGASVVIWGEVITFRGETEIQPSFTLVRREAPQPLGLDQGTGRSRPPVEDALGLEQRGAGALRLQTQAPNQIELRKTSAAGVGDTVLLLAALHALHAEEDPRKALALAEQAPPSVEGLRIAGQALRLLGRAGEAGARLSTAVRLEPQDPSSRALLADWLLEDGRLAEAAALYAAVQEQAPGTATRTGTLFEGKLYRQYVPDPDPDGVGPDSTYVVAFDPASGRTVERHLLPGVPLSFCVRGSILRVSYDAGTPRTYGAGSSGTSPREVEIAGGRVLGPCPLPPVLQRIPIMKTGWSLAANFSVGRPAPGSPAWDGRYARLAVTRTEPDPRVPMRLEDLETALRAASERDPTQPWHLFFLGQALRALGRDSESEATFQGLFARSFPGIGWYEWSWMASRFEQGGQPGWTDRAIRVASARRRETLPPPGPGTLIERLANGAFMRSAALAVEMAPRRRHELLRQARLLTGPSLEQEDHAALLWARFLRGAGQPEAAAEEERLARELTGSPANLGRISGVAYRAAFVWAAACLAGLALVLLAGTQIVRRARSRPRARGSIPGVLGTLTRRERQALAFAALCLAFLSVAQQVLLSRVFSGPFGLQDSLGHPALAEALAKRAGPGADGGAVFVAATALHLSGDAKTARELYGRIRKLDARAGENAAALERREPPRRFPDLHDLEALWGRLDLGKALPFWPLFVLVGLFVLVLALVRGDPTAAPLPGAPRWAGCLVPGLIDVGVGRPARAWTTWFLLAFALLASLWDLPGASMFPAYTASSFPLPPGAGDLSTRLWLVVWAVPADRLWWALVAAALAVGLALHLESVRGSARRAGAPTDPA